MNDDEYAPPGLTELAAVPLCVGMLAGSLFGVLDVLLHTRRGMPSDILYAAFMAAPAAAALALAVAVPLGATLWLFHERPHRAQWLGITTAVAGLGLVAAMALVTPTGLTARTGFALFGAAIVGGSAAIAVFPRVRKLDSPASAITWSLAALLALLVAAGGAVFLEARGWPRATAIGPMVLSVALAAGLASRRRALLSILTALLFFSVGLFVWGNPSIPRPDRIISDRPNVIMIVLDTTRVDHLGAYGDTRGLTPRLDELAADSVVYEDAFSTSHWTVPAHASLFTGLHPVEHGCTRLEQLRLEDRFETLAEILRADGYATAAMYSNVWLSSTNQLQGFDDEIFLERAYRGGWMLGRAAALGAPAHWIDKGGELGERKLATWLADDRPDDAPFFLFINLLEAHSKYVAPYGYRQDSLPDGAGYMRAGEIAHDFHPIAWNLTGDRDEEVEKIIPAMYAAEVRYQDVLLGRLLDLLRDATDFDNNLIIVTGDHGENLHEGLRWGHEFAVNDDLIRVPMIVRYPQPGPPPRRISGMAQLTDVVPTILDALDHPARPELPGRSLRPEVFQPWEAIPLHAAPEYTWLAAIYGQGRFTEPAFHELMAHKRVLRTPEYKYVWSSDGKHALYSPASDPSELDNLIERDPETALLLHTRLMDWWHAQPAFEPTENVDSEPMSEELLERLRALGYIR